MPTPFYSRCHAGGHAESSIDPRPTCASPRGGACLSQRTHGTEYAACRRAAVGRTHRGMGRRAPAGRPFASRPAKFHDAIRAFAGSRHYMLDYLLEEVLARQPAAIHASCCILPFWAACAGHFATQSPAQARVRPSCWSSERQNLFVVPLDEERFWFRYHHLFAELLRARLHQVAPEEVNGLHLPRLDLVRTKRGPSRRRPACPRRPSLGPRCTSARGTRARLVDGFQSLHDEPAAPPARRGHHARPQLISLQSVVSPQSTDSCKAPPRCSLQ